MFEGELDVDLGQFGGYLVVDETYTGGKLDVNWPNQACYSIMLAHFAAVGAVCGVGGAASGCVWAPGQVAREATHLTPHTSRAQGGAQRAESQEAQGEGGQGRARRMTRPMSHVARFGNTCRQPPVEYPSGNSWGGFDLG